jgi:hypothetical protein
MEWYDNGAELYRYRSFAALRMTGCMAWCDNGAKLLCAHREEKGNRIEHIHMYHPSTL